MTEPDISIWQKLLERGEHFTILYREALSELRHAPMAGAVWHFVDAATPQEHDHGR